MTERDASKELRRRAVEIEPTVRVGKDGLSENLFEEIKAQLKNRRLIKVKILKNADCDSDEVAAQIAEATDSIVVDVRGGVLILTDKRTWTSLCQKKFDKA